MEEKHLTGGQGKEAEVKHYEQPSSQPIKKDGDPMVVHVTTGNPTRHVIEIKPKTGRPVLIAVHL